jgi:hypothetical protein
MSEMVTDVAVINLLGSKDSKDRILGLSIILDNYESSCAIAIFAELINDDDKKVRQNAAAALALIRHFPASNILGSCYLFCCLVSLSLIARFLVNSTSHTRRHNQAMFRANDELFLTR